MSVQDQIDRYIATQPASKRDELQDLHRRTLALSPNARLWFLDGRDEAGKVVTNPNIGYGAQSRTYADGDVREFYRVGLSANTAGISLYVMGLDDKTFLQTTYGDRLGKAKVTGYCIRFRSTKDIDMDVLEEVIGEALGRS